MLCLRCRNRIASWRGNCAACLTAVRRRIKAGETTEALEVAAGRMAASAKAAGRRRWSGKRLLNG